MILSGTTSIQSVGDRVSIVRVEVRGSRDEKQADLLEACNAAAAKIVAGRPIIDRSERTDLFVPVAEVSIAFEGNGCSHG